FNKWGTQLLCWVSLCLLGLSPPSTGHMDAGITQSPRNEIARTGKNVTLRCYQTENYDYMYWYRQDLGHGLRLIYYSINTGSTEKGEVSDGYNISRPNTEEFHLILPSVTSSQTSVYFCANSYPTALHSCLLFRRGSRLPVKQTA
uniref:Ig-like domain-containing protein n=1 Tax=Neovison vison TaxID=452646 RepID=A0A8C7BUL3_NEOVI